MATSQTVGASEKYGKHRRGAGHGFARTVQETAATDAPPLPDSLAQEIGQVAYFLAEARGFEPGHELEDWTEAERQVAASHAVTNAANEARH